MFSGGPMGPWARARVPKSAPVRPSAPNASLAKKRARPSVCQYFSQPTEGGFVDARVYVNGDH